MVSTLYGNVLRRSSRGCNFIHTVANFIRKCNRVKLKLHNKNLLIFILNTDKNWFKRKVLKQKQETCQDWKKKAGDVAPLLKSIRNYPLTVDPP